MTNTLKKRVKGFFYLLSHPKQVKWLIIRETRYGKRNRNKSDWVKWQKYDAKLHISMMQENVDALSCSVLNSTRIQIFSTIISNLGTGLDILDVGCGEGAISKPVAKMGNHVTCLELPGVANLARRCQVQTVVAGDAEQIPFTSDSFNMILASEVIEHLWNPIDFLNEAHRALKPEGYLIAETPEGEEGLNYDSHKHYFTVERLKQMVGEKFNVCEVKHLEATGRAQTPTIIMLLRKSVPAKK